MLLEFLKMYIVVKDDIPSHMSQFGQSCKRVLEKIKRYDGYHVKRRQN